MIMSVIGKGDALVVTKFDRLGRNMLDMLMISEELKAKGANLVSLAEQIDTSTAMGNAFFQITGIFAEMERGRILPLISSRLNSLASWHLCALLPFLSECADCCSIRINLETLEDSLRLWVRDDGVGFSASRGAADSGQ